MKKHKANLSVSVEMPFDLYTETEYLGCVPEEARYIELKMREHIKKAVEEFRREYVAGKITENFEQGNIPTEGASRKLSSWEDTACYKFSLTPPREREAKPLDIDKTIEKYNKHIAAYAGLFATDNVVYGEFGPPLIESLADVSRGSQVWKSPSWQITSGRSGCQCDDCDDECDKTCDGKCDDCEDCKEPEECTCEWSVVSFQGCQCGAFKREKERKK
jgi:hypothetical protein